MIETAASKSCNSGAASPYQGVDRSDRVLTATQRRRYNPLLWLNLVCLDAPLVAVTWQWLFARAFGIEIANGTTAALFLSAWLVYLADRFGDNLLLGANNPTSLRQEFCLRHRRAWLCVIALVAIADFVTIAARLDSFAVSVGSTIGFVAAIYLLVNRFRPSLWRILPLKEMSIGFIFAAGTMVGLLRSLPSAAILPWVLFAALCAMNCICIAFWERPLDLAQGRISIATEFPHFARGIFPVLLVIALAGSFVTLPLLFSAVLLSAVHFFRDRIEPNTRTALADLVLLTPLLFWGARHVMP